jgi:hypothetical protein
MRRSGEKCAGKTLRCLNNNRAIEQGTRPREKAGFFRHRVLDGHHLIQRRSAGLVSVAAHNSCNEFQLSDRSKEMKPRLVLVCSILVAVAVALGCGQTTPPKDDDASAAVNAELATMQGEWKVVWEGDPLGIPLPSPPRVVDKATIEKRSGDRHRTDKPGANP